MQGFTSGWFLTFGKLAYWMAYILFEVISTPKVTPQQLRDSALRKQSDSAERDLLPQRIVTAR